MTRQTTNSRSLRCKCSLEPGVRYHGSICINEYGEIDFTPEQKGANPQGSKELKRGDGWAIFTTKNCIKVRMTFPKQDSFVGIARLFMKITSQVQLTLMNYKFN